VAASFGVVLGFPVLRLRGDYLAIVTLGFGEIIRIVLLNWASVTGGPNGIGGIPRPSFFGLPFARSAPEGATTFNQFFGLEFSPDHRVIFLYFVILAMALLTNAFTLRIRRLPIGRAWEALREDEVACRALGINPTTVKLSAFAIGAMAAWPGAFSRPGRASSARRASRSSNRRRSSRSSCWAEWGAKWASCWPQSCWSVCRNSAAPLPSSAC
jgi:branched-chain amino acid transport system permease protein